MDETRGSYINSIDRNATPSRIPTINSDGDFDTETEIGRFSQPLLTFAAIATGIIMILGIVGNLLTVIALLRSPKVRNVAAAFIISLCIADAIFCALVLPFSIFRFVNGTSRLGDFLCKLIPFIQYGNVGVSLLCIAMITINRYVMIANHSYYGRIYKRHWIVVMIIFCWVFSYGMQIPTFFGVWGAFGYDHKLGTCSILRDEFGRSSKTPLFIIAFVIPCIIIIGCYTKIFWVVHQSELRMKQHAVEQNSIPNNKRPPPVSTSTMAPEQAAVQNASSNYRSSNSSVAFQMSTYARNLKCPNVRGRQNDWRITKMVLAIFVSFIMCYLPITIVKITDSHVNLPGFHICGYIMLYLSACTNPIIYVIMNKQYRQAYKTILTCSKSKLPVSYATRRHSPEKWKDVKSNCSHSRTMVSQVSIAD